MVNRRSRPDRPPLGGEDLVNYYHPSNQGDRNRQVYRDHQEGMSYQKLAEKYGFSRARGAQIVDKVAQRIREQQCDPPSPPPLP